MPYKKQQDLIDDLVKEFDLNKDTFRCYTLDSKPEIKVITFGKQDWPSCHIGLLINKHFHVLGLGSFSFINEDVKALYISLVHSLPQDVQKLTVLPYSLFNDEEQENIINKFKQIFPEL